MHLDQQDSHADIMKQLQDLKDLPKQVKGSENLLGILKGAP